MRKKIKATIRRVKAVSPVLATLLMRAVAVSMSVIMFMWSQNFLSTTSEAAAGQQAVQNRAAQSSIGIESVNFPSGENTHIQAIVRNTGNAYINIGGVYINGEYVASEFTTSNEYTSNKALWMAFDESGSQINTLDTQTGTVPPRGYALVNIHYDSWTPGQTYTIKITTTVGTFAETTLMVSS